MVNSLVVFPYSGEEDMRAWLVSQDIEPPEAMGSVPDVALLERILHEADWPFRQNSVDGTWSVMFESRHERWPPISEVTLQDDDFLGFRLGAHFGPFHVAREVSRTCGPQVAVEGSGANTCLVVPRTTYEEFHLLIAGVAAPADGRDREWSQPLSGAFKFAYAMPDEWPESPEAALDYALSGRKGHGRAAELVGHALANHRLGNQSRPAPGIPLDGARYAALVTRLLEHVRTAPIPTPGLVIALAHVQGSQPDFAALVARLEGVDGAEESLRMASLFARRG